MTLRAAESESFRCATLKLAYGSKDRKKDRFLEFRECLELYTIISHECEALGGVTGAAAEMT